MATIHHVFILPRCRNLLRLHHADVEPCKCHIRQHGIRHVLTIFKAQIGLNVVSGLDQCGPLTLVIALVQFTAPHAYLGTATGLGFSAKLIGGAFGTAVVDAIVDGKLVSVLAPQISDAAVPASLSKSSLPALLEAMTTSGDDRCTSASLDAAGNASH